MFRLVSIYTAALLPFWLAIYRHSHFLLFPFAYQDFLHIRFPTYLGSLHPSPLPPRRPPHQVPPVLMLSPTIFTVRFSPYGLMKWASRLCGERLGRCIWLVPFSHLTLGVDFGI